ncbi:MAG: DUF5597 domain-containing protein [Clostridia bacterium]|nr:DUF5597 domain-containing protein [Clostridia bacterium]
MLLRASRAVHSFGGNLLEAPVYWCSCEPEEGTFDFSQVRELIDLARQEKLYLILLWFGVNKNGHPTYVPEWVKRDPIRFPLVKGPDGMPVPTLSPYPEETVKADIRAFEALMTCLRDYDGETGTVLAVQIENEVGFANTDRDYGEAGEACHAMAVPENLRSVSIEGSDAPGNGNTWTACFGRYANEALAAWSWADFIEKLAIAGRKIYDLPMLVNVMLGENSIREPGMCYNSGGAVSRVLEIWKRTAKHIDLIGPDIYLPDRDRFLEVLEAYDREDNTLFIPETMHAGEPVAMHMMHAFADHGCVGLCCFGAESMLDSEGNLLESAETVVTSLRTVRSVAPLLLRYRGTGRVHAIVQQEFMDSQYLPLEGWHAEAAFVQGKGFFGLGSYLNARAPENRDLTQTRGRALLIQTGESEFFLAGAGVKVDFRSMRQVGDEAGFARLMSRMSTTLNFLSVEEGHFEGDTWVTERYRNGDEANFACYVHRGEVVRIRLNTAF